LRRDYTARFKAARKKAEINVEIDAEEGGRGEKEAVE